MTKPIMSLQGMDGGIDLLPDRVVIHRKGIWGLIMFGSNAKREIPLMALSEVVFQEPTFLKRFGDIEFVRSGVVHDRKKKTNHYAVKFKKAQLQEFEKFKEKVFELLQQHARSKQ